MRFAALSDKGKKRSVNEDNFFVNEKLNFLWLLMVWEVMLQAK